MKIFNTYDISRILKEDAKEVHRMLMANSQRFSRYFPLTLAKNETIESAKIFAHKKQEQFLNNEEFLFTIKYKEAVIGLVYIKELDRIKKQAEFAYCLDKAFAKKGIMSEAIKNLSAYAFSDLGLEILQIIVNKDNPASIKVAQHVNFKWQRTLLKEFTPPNGAPLDMELYELYK